GIGDRAEAGAQQQEGPRISWRKPGRLGKVGLVSRLSGPAKRVKIPAMRKLGKSPRPEIHVLHIDADVARQAEAGQATVAMAIEVDRSVMRCRPYAQRVVAQDHTPTLVAHLEQVGGRPVPGQ